MLFLIPLLLLVGILLKVLLRDLGGIGGILLPLIILLVALLPFGFYLVKYGIRGFRSKSRSVSA